VADIYEEMKKNKKWHHNIEMIDGKFIEDVVEEFQDTNEISKKETLLRQILDNYSIFRQTWAKAYANFLDSDVEAGKLMHDEIVWRSAHKFNRKKCKKRDGKAFNAYLVSSQMNWLKNLRNSKMSHKNHPRVICPICGEEVYQIDAQHLKHKMTLEKYLKIYSHRPLKSFDGSFVAKKQTYYTVHDFWKEHGDLKPKFPIKCPLTGGWLNEIPENLPSLLFKGYTEEEFFNDFPDFAGAIVCPYTGKKKLAITQRYLDEVLKQEDQGIRQVPVINPYTNQTVPEITFHMLQEANTTLHEHIYNYKTIELNKTYDIPVRCPFTGKKTLCITDSDLGKLDKSAWEFYVAVCKYPVRKFEVKCACGDWVENIWNHLEAKDHTYAEVYTPEQFSVEYSVMTTRAFVSTNSFFESDSGDSMHISDLVSFYCSNNEALEIEDSLLHVAQDEIDKHIAQSIRSCHTVEDIYHASATQNMIDGSLAKKDTKNIRAEIRQKTGSNDFDILTTSEHGDKKLVVSFPSRDTIRKRLQRMIQASDLYNHSSKEQQKWTQMQVTK